MTFWTLPSSVIIIYKTLFSVHTYILTPDLLKRATAKGFIGIFKYAEVIKEFNVDLFFKFVEIITVCDGEKLIVSLLDGIEIEVKTE